MWFLQRRFHKDILLNPVLVLSFCPDLSSKPGHLGTATRELLFLLDGSSVAHKACGDMVWAGLRWAGDSLSKTHTHSSLFLILTYISPRVQKPLSYVMLHSVALNPKPKVPDTPPESHMRTSLTHTQSPSNFRVSLMVLLTHSLTQSLSSASSSFHTGSGEGRPSGVPQACLMLPSRPFPRMP